jgi:hypothetical protein
MCGLQVAGGAICPANMAPIRPPGGGFRNFRRRGSGARFCKPFWTEGIRWGRWRRWPSIPLRAGTPPAPSPERPGNPQGGMETDSRRRPGLMRPARRRAEESLKRAMEARFFASSTTTAGRTTRRSGPPNPEAAAPPEAAPPRPGKVPLGRAPFPGPARGPDEAAGGRSSLEGASRSVSVTQPAHRTPQAPCPPSREWFSGLPPLPSPLMSASPSLPLWDWLPLASARTDLPPGRSPRGQIRIPLPLPKEASPAASPSAPRPGPAGRLARRTALVANGPSGREAFPEAKRGLGARHAAGPGRGSPQGGSDGCPPASFARHLPFPRAIHATEPSKRRAGSPMTRANPRTLSQGGCSQKAPPRPQPPGRGMERGDPAASTDSPKAKWKGILRGRELISKFSRR